MTTEQDKAPKIIRVTEDILRRTGQMTSFLIAALIVAIITQVVLRYVFKNSIAALEELQWHLYAVVIMIGLSYAFVTDSHIRLDILHTKFSRRKKEKMEIFGIVCFLMPMIMVFFFHSLGFVAESWRVGECSDAPMGLCYRWALKSVITLSFGLLLIAAICRLIRAWSYLNSSSRRDFDGS